MKWDRSNTLALATQKCTQCRGFGLRMGRRTNPCDCVLRSIFRSCYERFVQYASDDARVSSVHFEIHSGPDRRGTWGLKEEEYMADFLNVARRTLNDDDYRIFRFRFLLGADWHLCSKKLNMDRGSFFHAVYRIQQELGRAFAELEPYPLFPLTEYFNTIRRQTITALPASKAVKSRPLRPPLASPERKAA